MKRQTCPRCQRHSLFQTGAFWACGVCSYAITQAALLIRPGRCPSQEQTRADRQSDQGQHGPVTTT